MDARDGRPSLTERGSAVVDLRELKALEIAAKAKISFDGTYWIVPSQTTGMKYRVIIGHDPSCGCDDFQLRKQPCKHVIAARIVCSRDHGGKAPEIVVDAVPKKPTYRQNWPAYNLAQSIEKRRLQALLFDLCQGVEEPPDEGRTGRKPHMRRDRLFSMAYKVYSTFSARRFSCDLADAHERGYLAKIIPGLKVPQFFEDATLTPILQRLIVQSSLPLKAVETVFAPDSTGFSTSRFVRWYDEKYGTERSGRDWVKAHAICGVKTNVVTAVTIEGRDAGDSPQFKPLVEQTAENFRVEEVTADKAYLSHDNLAVVAGLGGTAFIPFKSNSGPGEDGSLWGKMYYYFGFRRQEFLKHYHQRSNVESTFSMLKAKFKDSVRSKTDVAMRNEVLCKFLCHNICCVIQSQCELGIEAVFWPAQADDGDDPGVLPLIRPANG
jgi:transposase